MNLDTVQDSTRVVVSDVRHGNILPGNRAEMWRDLFLLPGADVRGAAWGNRLTVEGPGVKVGSSVYVRGEIHVLVSQDNASQTGDVTFGSCVATPDSVLVDPVPFRVRFLANIYTEVVNLRNSVVYGNVYARSGVIRDSVILGGVFCREGLTLENCMVATFRAGKVTIGPDVSLFFPIAVAEQPIELKFPVKALSFYNLSDSQEEISDEVGGAVILDGDDVYQVVDEMREEEAERGSAYVLSMDQRVMDADRMMAHFRKNRQFLEFLALGNHLDPAVRGQLRSGAVTELENRLMGMLEREDIPEVDGYSKMEDLFVRADVVNAIRAFSSDEIAQAVQTFRLTPDEEEDRDEVPPDTLPEIDHLFQEGGSAYAGDSLGSDDE